MRQRTKSAVTVVVAVVAAIGMFFAGFFAGRIKDPDVAALEFIVKTYKKHYLEYDEDFVSIMSKSILDEYSEYYTKEEYAELKKISSGVRGGIGISYGDRSDGSVVIAKVLGNSPAERAGIKAGYIVKGFRKSVDENFTEINGRQELSDALAPLALGEEFVLKLEYTDADGVHEKECTLARKEYRETYVYYSDDSGSWRFTNNNADDMDDLEFERYDDPIAGFENDTAYLRYTFFYGTANGILGSVGQIQEALKKFTENGKRKLILDLRGNGGGYVDICQSVAKFFVPAPENSFSLIATAEYKKDPKTDKGKTEIFKSSAIEFGTYNYDKIIVLADENTASASEMLIGAMLSYDTQDKIEVVLAPSKDDDGQTVYKSYGKGIMQTTYVNTFGGGALKLTTAKLVWPDGKTCIHGVGITKSLEGYGEKIWESAGQDPLDVALARCKSRETAA